MQQVTQVQVCHTAPAVAVVHQGVACHCMQVMLAEEQQVQLNQNEGLCPLAWVCCGR